MTSIQWKSLVLVLLFFVRTTLAAAADVELAGETQAELNDSAGAALKASEAEMKKLLDVLIRKAAKDSASLAKLRESQKAWEHYRDAQLAARWPHQEREQYGSVLPMCFALEKKGLTDERVAQLRSMDSHTEGDVCGSYFPE